MVYAYGSTSGIVYRACEGDGHEEMVSLHADDVGYKVVFNTLSALRRFVSDIDEGSYFEVANRAEAIRQGCVKTRNQTVQCRNGHVIRAQRFSADLGNTCSAIVKRPIGWECV